MRRSRTVTLGLLVGALCPGCALVDAAGETGVDADAAPGLDAPAAGVDASGADAGATPLFALHAEVSAGGAPLGAMAIANAPGGKHWIAVLNPNGNRVSILTEGAEPGDLELLPNALDVGVNPQSIVARDLDGDGLDDLVVGSEGGGPQMTQVHVFYQIGGTPPFSSPLVLSDPDAVPRVGVGDVDADGKPDILITQFGGMVEFDQVEGVHVFFRTGDGPADYSAPGIVVDNQGGNCPAPTPEFPLATDMDGDGRDDIIAVAHEPTFCIYFQDGAGTFVGFFFDTGGPNNMSDVQVAPLAEGAAPSVLAIIPPSPNPVPIGSPGKLVLFVPDPINSQQFSSQVFDGEHAAIFGQIADVTGDGLSDLVTVGQDDLTVYEQTGTRAFEPISLTGPGTPSDVEVVDVDGDGHRDVLFADRDGGTIAIFLSTL